MTLAITPLTGARGEALAIYQAGIDEDDRDGSLFGLSVRNLPTEESRHVYVTGQEAGQSRRVAASPGQGLEGTARGSQRAGRHGGADLTVAIVVIGVRSQGRLIGW